MCPPVLRTAFKFCVHLALRLCGRGRVLLGPAASSTVDRPVSVFLVTALIPQPTILCMPCTAWWHCAVAPPQGGGWCVCDPRWCPCWHGAGGTARGQSRCWAVGPPWGTLGGGSNYSNPLSRHPPPHTHTFDILPSNDFAKSPLPHHTPIVGSVCMLCCTCCRMP
jgi:hypothetical protein